MLPTPGTPLFVISTVLALGVLWVVVPWLYEKVEQWFDQKEDE